MQEKLSQYDLLARLVPGGALLWTANWLMTASKAGSIPLVQGGITEAIAYALVAYVTGLILDSLGRWVIEPFVFRVFGKPSSTILTDHKGISEIERSHYKSLAASKLRLTEAQMLHEDPSAETSEFISRRVMAMYGQSNDKVKSMYIQYTLHRSLSAALLLLIFYSLHLCTKGRLDWGVILVEASGLFVFLLGTNHWAFRMVRASFELLDADSVGVKSSTEVKAE